MQKLDFYEFFAGGGMARAGLGANWQCLYANDFDARKVETYRANWGSGTIECKDVAKVDADTLPGHPHLLWASFPCQDLSLAGKRAGLSGERSGSFWPFWKLVSDLISDGRKPRAIVLENVCGLLTSNGGADFAQLCEKVADSGYWIGAIVADACDFLPHSRPRLFFIALDMDFPVAGATQSPNATDHWHPARLQNAQSSLPEATKGQWLWFSQPIPPKRNIELIDLLEKNTTDVAWHSKKETDRLLSMMSDANRRKVDKRLVTNQPVVGAIYKRTRVENGQKMQRAEIRFDMAGCLRTPGGGSSRQFLLYIESGTVRTRLISARETARLMGLSDDYRLPENYTEAYHLSGDGVAVPVVRWIAQQLLEPTLNLPGQLLERRYA